MVVAKEVLKCSKAGILFQRRTIKRGINGVIVL